MICNQCGHRNPPSSTLCSPCGAPRHTPRSSASPVTLLRRRGLVEGQRQGDTVVYSLRDRRVIDAIDLLRQVMHEELTRRQAVAVFAATSTTPGHER